MVYTGQGEDLGLRPVSSGCDMTYPMHAQVRTSVKRDIEIDLSSVKRDLEIDLKLSGSGYRACSACS